MNCSPSLHHTVWPALFICLALYPATALTPTPDELQQAASWTRTDLLGSTQPPFSFVCAEEASALLIGRWKVERQSRALDPSRTEHTRVWTDPVSGLALRCAAIEHHDFPVVEWTVFLRNDGPADSPLLSEIQALDFILERGEDGEFLLRHHQGDLCTPDSYAPRETPLPPKSEHRFAPIGGRPTQGAFPYFGLEWPGRSLLLAVGWPGQWNVRFTRDQNRRLRLQAGQEQTRFRLHPGEEVRTPLVALQFGQSDRLRTQNLWRRWMMARNLPRTQSGRLPPPILSSCSGGFFPGLKCNESDELRFIDAFTRAGVDLDYWWMDAGWYPCGPDWTKVGTWTPDPERFPRGIKPISDHAHAKGMGLILWFEPERVVPGSWLHEHHAEWLLGQGGGVKLLNLGDPAARQWLTDHVDRLIKQQGIDLYRQDFNMDPLPYWRANDAPDRQGVTEIRHVEGYLAFWDQLRRRNPDLLIDSCASGGRRNDLETLRRAVPLLRSDYQSFAGDPGFAPGNQGHTYGLAAWIPYYGQGAYYSDHQLLYTVRSYSCPAFGFCADARKPDVDWNLVRHITEQWRQMAPCYLGDFYPLTPYTLDPLSWMAWQFDLPESGRGLVQAFRRDQSPFEAARFPLQSLDPLALYTVTDLDAPEAGRPFAGGELMRPGLLVTCPTRPQARVFLYQKQ